MIFSKILRPAIQQQKIALSNYKQLNFSALRYFAQKKELEKKERGPRPSKEQQYTAFLFDEENKTPIFEHMLGERDLRIAIRIFTIFTIMNVFLAIGEYQYPIFGGWNSFSFSLCALTGIGLLTFFSVFSKRTIHKMKLLRTGDFVEVSFFNAFWVPQTKMIHVSEFANMQASFVGYSRSELTTLGKVWINLEKNAFYGHKAYEDILIEILNGKTVKLDSYVVQRAAQYQKKK
ncbi:hypothetical protein ABPG74_003007 [Tetrahymena malaccensis]